MWRGTRAPYVARMTLTLSILMPLHIAAGTLALLVLWIPAVARKGSRLHRLSGRVAVGAWFVLGATGLASTLIKLALGEPFGKTLFFAQLSVMTLSSALLGLQVARVHDGARGMRHLIAVAALFLVVSVGSLAFGAAKGAVVSIFFGGLGVMLAGQQLLMHLRPPELARAWMLTHMGAMGAASIATVTAFSVTGSRMLGLGTAAAVVWISPAVLLGAGLTLWTARWKRKLEG